MNPWIALAGYRPRKLETVLIEIRRSFPDLCGESGDPPPDRLEELRNRIRSMKEESISLEAYSFNPKELRGLTLLLCLPNESPLVRRRAEQILLLRPQRSLLVYGIPKLLAYYPAPTLERVLTHIVVHHSEETLVDHRFPVKVCSWLKSGSLLTGIVGEILNSSPISVNAWLTTEGLNKYDGLTRSVWDYLLAHGTQEFYSRHSANELLDEVRSRPSDLQQTFGRRYLTLLEAWQEPIPRWIHDRFGLPDDPIASPGFWNPLPPYVRERFRRWAMEHRLAAFFQDAYDPNGRFAFWKSFLDSIQEVTPGANGKVAIIDFGRFFVVEFAEVGNAAYVYPNYLLDKMKSYLSQPYNTQAWFLNYYLKDQKAALNRIIHREGWQMKYAPEIQDLILRRIPVSHVES